MAIDSEAKRKSIAAISLYPIGPVVVPDGTIGDEDRQAIGYGYYGIAADGGAGLTVPQGIQAIGSGIVAAYVGGGGLQAIDSGITA